MSNAAHKLTSAVRAFTHAGQIIDAEDLRSGDIFFATLYPQDDPIHVVGLYMDDETTAGLLHYPEPEQAGPPASPRLAPVQAAEATLLSRWTGMPPLVPGAIALGDFLWRHVDRSRAALARHAVVDEISKDPADARDVYLWTTPEGWLELVEAHSSDDPDAGHVGVRLNASKMRLRPLAD